MGVVKEMEFHKVSCSEYKDQVQLRFGQNEVEFKDQDLGDFFSKGNLFGFHPFDPDVPLKILYEHHAH